MGLELPGWGGGRVGKKGEVGWSILHLERLVQVDSLVLKHKFKQFAKQYTLRKLREYKHTRPLTLKTHGANCGSIAIFSLSTFL